MANFNSFLGSFKFRNYLTKMFYDERLQKAADYRRFRESASALPGVAERILQRVDSYLASTGQKLKTRYRPQATKPTA